MRTNTRNLAHLNDAELDICECNDNRCPACFGGCDRSAIVTMYDTTIPEEQQTGRRLCAHCADHLFEDSGGEWQTDFDRNPEEYDPWVKEVSEYSY